MKKLYSLILWLIFPFCAWSQSHYLNHTARWHETSGYFDGSASHNSDYYYHITGDTIINSIAYYKLMETGSELIIPILGASSTHPINGYIGALHEDTITKKISFIFKGGTKDTLLYNFGVSTFDAGWLKNCYGYLRSCYANLNGTDTVIFAGKPILRSFNYYNSYCAVFEGIGLNTGLLGQMPCNYIESGSCLLAFYKDQDSLIINGCSWRVSANVTKIINVTSCNGKCEGAANIKASGGVAPYHYKWPNNPNADTTYQSNLCAGTYVVTITENSSNYNTVAVVITEPPPASFGVTLTDDIKCYGNSGGTIRTQPTNGTPPYNYLWSNNATTDSISGLKANNYYLTVTDANGCRMTASGVITEPSAISLNINTTASINNDGIATVSASGGTSPYTYAWSDNQTTDTASGLASGIYYLTVTDINGCTALDTAVIFSKTNQIQATINSNFYTCFGICNGSATILVSGGTPPYKYLWSNGTSIALNTWLCGGTYTVTVTDNAQSMTTTAVTIIEDTPMYITVTQTPDSAHRCVGTVQLTSFTGGVPPFFSIWSQNGITIQYGGNSISGLCTGTYCYEVTDFSGCTESSCITIIDLLTTSINELNSPISESLKIWPNPVTGGVLHIEGAEKTDIVELYNLLGEKVLQAKATSTIDISSLPKGVYFVKLQNAGGERVCKIVIQ